MALDEVHSVVVPILHCKVIKSALVLTSDMAIVGPGVFGVQQ
jgi:hypothetical protein